MAKRTFTTEVSYTCEGPCGKPTKAQKDSAIELLRICRACQEKRYAKGKAEQERALAAEARAGGDRG